MNITSSANWHLCPTKSFWGEVATSNHVVQIYDNDSVLIETLAGFVGDGINEGDSTIVIATADHLRELERKLEAVGIHVDSLLSEERYIPLEANYVLENIMVNGMPDRTLFEKTILPIVSRLEKRKKKIRAYGELVALLWERGQYEATIEVERIWEEFMKQHPLTLLCGYPNHIFRSDVEKEVRKICNCHTHVISGRLSSMAHVRYQEICAN